jgi:hypothetical protein
MPRREPLQAFFRPFSRCLLPDAVSLWIAKTSASLINEIALLFSDWRSDPRLSSTSVSFNTLHQTQLSAFSYQQRVPINHEALHLNCLLGSFLHCQVSDSDFIGNVHTLLSLTPDRQ